MSDPNPNLAEIRNLPIAELVERLEQEMGATPPGLTAADLDALHALESAEADGGRKGALAAIDAARAKLAGAGAPEAGEPPPAAGKGGKTSAAPKSAAAAPAAKAPAWQAPDYTGPLDIEQAEWRARHIKPVRGVSTK